MVKRFLYSSIQFIGLSFLISTSLILSCHHDDVSTPSSSFLINNYDWSPVSIEGDPFKDHYWTNDSIECPEEQFKLWENNETDIWFEVTTEGCNWITVSAPLLIPLSKNNEIEVLIWRSVILEGDGPYSIGIQIGDSGAIDWITTEDIPANSGLISDTFLVNEGHAEDEPVYFHVSNHGINTWGMIYLRRVSN